MHLAYSLQPFGHHPEASQHSDVGSVGGSFEALARQAIQAEEAGFDFVLLDDAAASSHPDALSADAIFFEPTTLAAAIATKVRHIGLVASASTTEHAPYNLARRYASLDNESNGRSGWNVIPASEDPGRDVEYIGLVKSLWDSWEDDAFIYDKAAARFFRPEKMHVLNHEGPNFSVRGPLNVNRSPQGRPVISVVLSASSMDTAAKYADVVFLRENNLAQAQALSAQLQEQMSGLGRGRGDIKILVSVAAYLGSTTEIARKFYAQLNRGAVDHTAAEVIVGSSDEVADRIVSVVDRLKLDGIELQQPVVRESDFLLFGLASVLRDRLGVKKPSPKSTLRQLLGLRRPDFRIAQGGTVQ